MDERVHLARFLGGDELRDIEILDFARNPCGKPGRVKRHDRRDAAHTVFRVLPRRLDCVAIGRNQSHACNHHPLRQLDCTSSRDLEMEKAAFWNRIAALSQMLVGIMNPDDR